MQRLRYDPSGFFSLKMRLAKLAARVDTAGARRRMDRFRSGWAAKTSADIKFYRSPKVQYRYREQGAGQTIVFSVDPPMTLEAYDELLNEFAAHYRVLAVELPAMGFSATIGEYRFGWRETNDDLANFLRDVAGEKAVLAFSCVAGLAAVDVAVRYPNLVSRLVLIQTGDVEAFAKWKSARDKSGVLGRPFIGQYAMKKIAPNRLRSWFKLSVGERSKLDYFCRCAETALKHGALWSLASAFQIYLDSNIVLGRPDQPILALWGTADRSHPPESVESPRRLSRNVTFVAFHEVGHFPELEDPKLIFNVVDKFLKRGGKGGDVLPRPNVSS